jgi:hypothetical protein
MRKMCSVAVLCVLQVAVTTAAFAKMSRTKVMTASDVRQAVPLVDSCRGGLVCRQDLFDRNNRNNLRSDWPAPPAQPGQF